MGPLDRPTRGVLQSQPPQAHRWSAFLQKEAQGMWSRGDPQSDGALPRRTSQQIGEQRRTAISWLKAGWCETDWNPLHALQCWVTRTERKTHRRDEWRGCRTEFVTLFGISGARISSELILKKASIIWSLRISNGPRVPAAIDYLLGASDPLFSWLKRCARRRLMEQRQRNVRKLPRARVVQHAFGKG